MDVLPPRRIDPIFPVTDMARAIAHYEALGFVVISYDESYAFATWANDACLHLSLVSSPKDFDGKSMAAAAYLYVDDAAALCRRWKQACPTADVRGVVKTDYGMVEGAALDPDNNLIRFGSSHPSDINIEQTSEAIHNGSLKTKPAS